MKKQTSAIIQMIICAIFWSLAGILIKILNCNSLVIAGFRSAFAGITVFSFMLITKIKFLFNKKVFLTALFMSLAFLAFVVANKLTTSANAIVLQFTAPVFILIFSFLFFNQKVEKSDILVTVITLLGVVLFFLDQMGEGRFLGNLIAVFAGACMGAMLIFVGTVTIQEKFSGTLLAHIITAIVGFIALPFTKNTFDLSSFVIFVILGVVQIGIPYIILCFVSLKLRPIEVSILTVLEPLLNPLWVAIFYNEIPGYISLIGAVIILTTITLWCVVNDKKEMKGAKECQ